MKKIILVISFLVFLLALKAQDLESILSEPQTLELTISSPQPRLNERFQISLDINYLRAHIFKSAIGKVELSEQVGAYCDNNKMILNVKALEKGKNEIGPLDFTLNGTHYTTNKISYEVVDALPNTDEGLWFRKMKISDSTFCIIIEQRIPASGKKTNTSDNSFTLTTEIEYDKVAKFKDSYSIPGLSGLNANSYSDFGSIYDANGKQKQFMLNYSVYYFTIKDKLIRISITKDKFENLPDYYKFEEIIVQ